MREYYVKKKRRRQPQPAMTIAAAYTCCLVGAGVAGFGSSIGIVVALVFLGQFVSPWIGAGPLLLVALIGFLFVPATVAVACTRPIASLLDVEHPLGSVLVTSFCSVFIVVGFVSWSLSQIRLD